MHLSDNFTVVLKLDEFYIKPIKPSTGTLLGQFMMKSIGMNMYSFEYKGKTHTCEFFV